MTRGKKTKFCVSSAKAIEGVNKVVATSALPSGELCCRLLTLRREGVLKAGSSLKEWTVTIKVKRRKIASREDIVQWQEKVEVAEIEIAWTCCCLFWSAPGQPRGVSHFIGQATHTTHKTGDLTPHLHESEISSDYNCNIISLAIKMYAVIAIGEELIIYNIRIFPVQEEEFSFLLNLENVVIIDETPVGLSLLLCKLVVRAVSVLSVYVASSLRDHVIIVNTVIVLVNVKRSEVSS